MPSTNPFQVTDYVTYVAGSGNGVGEGIIWQVVKVVKFALWIDPIWTATGPSVRKRAKVHHTSVVRFDMVQFGEAIQQLQALALKRYQVLSGILPREINEGVTPTIEE